MSISAANLSSQQESQQVPHDAADIPDTKQKLKEADAKRARAILEKLANRAEVSYTSSARIVTL